MIVLGYTRVSTVEQGESGLGLESQRAQIVAEVARREGWTLGEVFEDSGFSAKTLRRPAITDALAELGAGRAEGLVVSKLDRLSRSLLDFAELMALSERQGWALVALDCAVDTSTPAGEAMASILATFAQFERRLIGQRTREGLAAKRARGERLGRERLIAPDVEEHIRVLRLSGLSIRGIAKVLSMEGVLAPGGGVWAPSTLQRVLVRA